MPYCETSAEWYEQASLLLKARPTTTHITSKYSVLKPNALKVRKQQKYAQKSAAKSADSQQPTSTPAPSNEPTATFMLKAYDPVSGTCLQYETTKAAEVGRLIGTIGRLGRHMAALPEAMEDLSAPADGTGISTPKVEEDVKAAGGPTESKTVPAAGPGGSKKKKKGKK